MRKVIEEVIFSNESSYDIYTHTGVNQGIINDIKDGYRSIDYISYIDAEKLYKYGMERSQLVSS
ncbi:hypothetical protein OXR01_04810 [Staphylococcus gallinarum]|uniref:Uncharacterized protein n=1 Tax=Staphylococcus gallinarum TaxID=1293 RepID=A0A2T4T0J5_STAGA|nr:hypothetical protein [Staphylococcus gallinarum]MBU7217373.1 hypothetical protein [Staphylococcus gallinarum]MCD8792545.1 hypothetical protein [Staphylococcus gallinarum]MCD8821337.1 hypothetical protein [Staphylococcus gallinarum]MCD8826855.1 hypothetical protein [Staphylococcus gallinarum]MCD8829295.1 hypothetical protein [Staphylococcus gallinarum]